ncbi:MAG: hypothetical protein NTY64_17120 [Deltaproteobacteria bacterium]|nr:hypothetical protein [Deltaproteobacteria bacterium]
MSKFDGFVKSPSAALPCILRRCGVLPSTPHSSGIVRLASGSFYFAIHSDGFLRDHLISIIISLYKTFYNFGGIFFFKDRGPL